jgi:hypothetical protein
MLDGVLVTVTDNVEGKSLVVCTVVRVGVGTEVSVRTVEATVKSEADGRKTDVSKDDSTGSRSTTLSYEGLASNTEDSYDASVDGANIERGRVDIVSVTVVEGVTVEVLLILDRRDGVGGKTMGVAGTVEVVTVETELGVVGELGSVGELGVTDPKEHENGDRTGVEIFGELGVGDLTGCGGSDRRSETVLGEVGVADRTEPADSGGDDKRGVEAFGGLGVSTISDCEGSDNRWIEVEAVIGEAKQSWGKLGLLIAPNLPILEVMTREGWRLLED